MKIRICILAFSLAGFLFNQSFAQIAISAGDYSQNFDALGNANATWSNNVTLTGWYSSKGTGDSTNYFADIGNSTAGGIHSYGVTGIGNSTDRALGSIGASSIIYTFGARFINDTTIAQTNITVSCIGEQWRSGSVASSQTLAFSYGVSGSPITNSFSAATWVNFAALNFVSPNLSASSSALDGNASTNRQFFSNVTLTGVSIAPGQELMLRWLDIDDGGFDSGLAIDDLVVTFNGGVSNPLAAPYVLTQPSSQTAAVGDDVTFMVQATGNPAPSYQWQFNGMELDGATNSDLVLTGVSTNQAGDYRVAISNSVGSTNSAIATLTVLPAQFAEAFSVLTYNVKGNGANDWSTNAPQVQAIARQLQYLQPDVITFNEIPFDLRYEMTNFIAAFLPNYNLAISSGTDGYICSAIVTRFLITRASKWLDGADLKPFGYTNTSTSSADNFTRDLFETEIVVPGFPQPVHIFTAHLKATESAMEYADNAAKRAAEAAAITNFLATNLFIPHPLHTYILAGDMNASDTNELAIQKLITPGNGLILTNPRNPVTSSINTYSTTTANPSSRLDYMFPSPLLFSNIRTSQVFRTDRLTPVPPNLNSNDCKVASDHLPVLMVFNNPYSKPFKLLSLAKTNTAVTLRWESVSGQPYRVETSSNLASWSTLSGSLLATGADYTFSTNLSDAINFFRVNRIP